MDLLLKTIQNVLAKPDFDHVMIIQYLFYDCIRCSTGKECSCSHIDKFRTMNDYATYVDAAYPYELIGAKGQNPEPSPMALH
jgi:hypothetical protein